MKVVYTLMSYPNQNPAIFRVRTLNHGLIKDQYKSFIKNTPNYYFLDEVYHK